MFGKSIKGVAKDTFADNKKEISIPGENGEVKLFVRELGYAELATHADKPDFMARLVQASVSDDKGNQFTLDEVMRMRKNVATIIFSAVSEVNGFKTGEDGQEKN